MPTEVTKHKLAQEMVAGCKDQAGRDDLKLEQNKEDVERNGTRKGQDTFEPDLEVKREPPTPERAFQAQEERTMEACGWPQGQGQESWGCGSEDCSKQAG